MKMDNTSAAHKSRLSCQTWVDQNGWPTTSSQGLVINPHFDPQHHSLSSSCDQTASYNHLQASSQSCMNTMSSGNSNQNPALFSTSHMNNVMSSNSIFSPSAPHLMSFAQQVPHTSSMQAATNQGKTLPLTTFHQSNQELQPCRSQHLPSLSANRAYKSFQTQLVSQGLPHGLPDQSVSLSSCGSGVDMSQATFGGLPEVSAGVSGSSNSYGFTSQEQPQWMSSSHGKEAAGQSLSHSDAHVSKQPKDTSSLADIEKKRLAILSQRAQLLKQLENIDVLLESLPPGNSTNEQLPHKAVQDDSPPSEQTETNDAQVQLQDEESQLSADCSPSLSCNKQNSMSDLEEPASPAESAETDKSSSGSEDDNDSNYIPQSDGDVSDAQSEKTVNSKGDSNSNPSSPTKVTPREQNKDESKEDESAAHMKTQKINRKKLSEAVEVQMSKKKGHFVGKVNYCPFCSKPVNKMARHLTRIHSDRAQVAVAFQYPVNSKERNRIWSRLIKEGNFIHNKDVLKTGEGQLVVRTRPHKPVKATDFVHCLYCFGLFKKKSMWKHAKTCWDNTNKADEPPEKKMRFISRCALLTKGCEDLSEGFRDILSDMIYDDVTEAIMEDQILLQFGEQMLSEYSHDVKNRQYIRQNLRHVARLMMEAQKSTPMQSLEDFFNPSNFQHVVSTVKVVAGYDPEKKTYSAPSVALKTGYHLQKVCDIVKNNAVKSGDANVVKSCENFLSLYRKKWTKLISSDALTNIKESKRKNDEDAPFAEDVKLLHQHMENVQELAEKKLKESVGTENYVALVRVVLARTIAFNRRKPGEVASISLTAFSSRKKSDVLDDMDVSVSDLERTLCGFFSRVDIKGNCGRMLPVLLKPSFESAIELLISVRGECGVLSNNTFVFARPASSSTINAGRCIRTFFKECGAKNPAALTLLKLRHHFATMLPRVYLTDDEARHIFGSKPNMMSGETDMNSEVSQQPSDRRAATTGPHQFYTSLFGPVQLRATTTSPSKPKTGLCPKTRPKWDEAEVEAVERHLVSFIKDHRLPQKDDCVRCLEAEPRALRNRSWKGVKDYVRNRITTLQRLNGTSKQSLKIKKKKKRRMEEPQQSSETSPPSDRQEAAAERHSLVSSSKVKATNPDQQQTHGGTTSSKPASRSDKSRAKDHKTKPKWDEAEVHAVEKHLMRFIKDHRLPQKDDCVRCLEAEPRALRNRSWKGVKDYVRNRITTLQRQSGSSKTLSKTSKKRRREEPRQRSTVRSQLSDRQEAVSEHPSSVSRSANQNHQQESGATKTAAAPKSDKSKGVHPKTKNKWDEAEVHAVEKHLMQFIKKRKLPQKDDCVQCLEAEPEALRNRSWKGVKDYVRNRITTLQRLSGL